MLDLISTYQQCQDLKVDTSLDDLEIKDLEEFEDSLESWDCFDGHVNGHVDGHVNSACLTLPNATFAPN